MTSTTTNNKTVSEEFLSTTTSTTQGGEVTSPVGEEEMTQKDYYQKANHYDDVWGADNIHFGYYPHLEKNRHDGIHHKEEEKIDDTTKLPQIADEGVRRLNQDEASSLLTQRIIDMANIKKDMRVIDLGAGKGRACYEIATKTGATCIGLDITPAYVQRGNEIAECNPNLNLKFVDGSFTDLPKDLLDIVKTKGPFDVVFAQVALCHVHSQIDEILEQIKLLMGPNSLLVVNDYLGGDDGGVVSDATKEHVYKRLHFETLLGHEQWKEAFDKAGFHLIVYENLDIHMKQGYLDMATTARQLNFKSTDGTPLYLNYLQTVEAIDRHEIGMNLAMYQLKPRSSIPTQLDT